MKIAENIYIEGANGSREYDINAVHAAGGKIFLNDSIDMEKSLQFLALTKYLSAEKKDITLYINSTGGDVEAGLVIYDLIQSYPYGIDIYCVGIAASMAALLLASGKKGRRFILPHSKVLIHEPLIASGFGGSATNIDKTAQRILEVKAQLNALLSKHTGKTVKEINKATSFDNLMTAEQAIAFGLCDEIRTIY
ncbi:MAG TPA: ClpP family protease [Ruminococcus sp.]|nr:ClpP family protease [Ruminococcus sp.]